MRDKIVKMLTHSASIKMAIAQDASLLDGIERTTKELLACVKRGGTIFSCGNGGSTCDAMHLTEELVARYKTDRPGIRAQHFMDPPTLTCWSNDIGFETAMARQVETFCTERDVLIVLSTSGNSPNILRAVEAAKKSRTFTVGLAGRGGGKLAPMCDVALIVPADESERIQEAHITFIHIFCDFLETVHRP